MKKRIVHGELLIRRRVLNTVVAMMVMLAARPAIAQSGAAPDTARAMKTELRPVLERYFPEVLASGMGETDVIFLVVSPRGRVVKHLMLHTIPGTTGAQIEHELEAYGASGVESVDIIKRKPGELAPTGVSFAWVDLTYEPSEPGPT